MCTLYFIVVDEYLNSYNNGNCEQNTNDLRVNAAVVLDVCAVNNFGEWIKITCEEDDSSSSFGYALTLTNYTGLFLLLLYIFYDDQCFWTHFKYSLYIKNIKTNHIQVKIVWMEMKILNLLLWMLIV